MALPSNSSSIAHVPVNPVSTFHFETVCKTILRIADSGLLKALAEDPAISLPTLTAMQRLIEVINRLRSPENGRYVELSLTPETLAPYITDEAYDVLDAEQLQATGAIAPDQATPQSDSLSTSQSAYLISVETLIAYFLWSIVRSSYTVMQLIEGIRVQCCQDGSIWAPGMLRLAILLEAESSAIRWSFDLATNSAPTSILSDEVLIQSDENLFPFRPSAVSSGDRTTQEVLSRAKNQLWELTQQIQSTTPAIKSLFDGIDVDFLQPGEEWQSGQIRLKLGFEFIAEAENWTDTLALQESVEAELFLEDIHGDNLQTLPLLGADATVTSELPGEGNSDLLMGVSTIIRLADPTMLEYSTQLAVQYWAANAVSRLQQSQIQQHESPANPEEQVLKIIQAASVASDRMSTLGTTDLSLLQPELLMDELLPKLLWQVTRSAYDVMQLVGGVAAQVLQPRSHWEAGILRLAITLHVKTTEKHWSIDLATGQTMDAVLSTLHPETVCQRNAADCLRDHSHHLWLYQQPVQAKQLRTILLEVIRGTTPQIGRFMQGIQVEWLEAEQDWQSATLQVECDLVFSQ